MSAHIIETTAKKLLTDFSHDKSNNAAKKLETGLIRLFTKVFSKLSPEERKKFYKKLQTATHPDRRPSTVKDPDQEIILSADLIIAINNAVKDAAFLSKVITAANPPNPSKINININIDSFFGIYPNSKIQFEKLRRFPRIIHRFLGIYPLLFPHLLLRFATPLRFIVPTVYAPLLTVLTPIVTMLIWHRTLFLAYHLGTRHLPSIFQGLAEQCADLRAPHFVKVFLEGMFTLLEKAATPLNYIVSHSLDRVVQLYLGGINLFGTIFFGTIFMVTPEDTKVPEKAPEQPAPFADNQALVLQRPPAILSRLNRDLSKDVPAEEAPIPSRRSPSLLPKGWVDMMD